MKKNSTKILAATLALVMAAAMTACGRTNNSSSSIPSATPTPPVSTSPSESTPAATPATPEELGKKYEDAIIAARDEEMNKYNYVTTNANKDSIIERYMAMAKENATELTPEDADKQYTQELDMLATVIGLNLEDAQAYAISASMMNVKAYGIAIVKPVEGKEAAVEKALKDYVAAQQKAFESYLVDQKEIADAAVVKTLEDGTIIMVMSEKQDEIVESITASLSK